MNKHRLSISCVSCKSNIFVDKRSTRYKLGDHVCKPCRQLNAACRVCTTSLSEYNWRKDDKDRGSKICVSCDNDRSRPKTDDQILRRKEVCKNYRENNKENIKKSNSKWYEKTRKENPEILRTKVRRYQSSEKGQAVHAANQSLRKARLKKACPSWANLDKIRDFYIEAGRLTRETGICHEVDHIIPISGKQDCGFHVENNLQIITASANQQKKNNVLSYDRPLPIVYWLTSFS